MADRRIQLDEFLPAYLKACEQGLTREEFARKMGLKPATIYQRTYELRRQLKERGQDLPTLRTEGKKSLIDRAAAILEKHSGKPAKAKKAEPEVELEEAEDPLAELLG